MIFPAVSRASIRRLPGPVAALLLLGSAPPPAAPNAAPAPSAPATAAAQTAPGPDAPTPLALRPARLPGFAAELADRPLAPGPGAWQRLDPATAWQALALAPQQGRQAARWAYGVDRVARGLGPEALGVFDTMQEDDPDMALVPAFRRARGAALALLGRSAEALDMLTAPLLMNDAEACLWRLLAQSGANRPQAALAELHCALPAFNQRRVSAAAPFIRAAAAAAVATGNQNAALGWLAQLPDGDAAANLLRGQALLGLGRVPEGRLRLERVQRNGTGLEQAEAELALIEGLSAHHALAPAEGLRRVDRLLFLWHGGAIEQRALNLAYRLAAERRDGAALLRYGGLLLRYGSPGADGSAILATCQRQLGVLLRPDSGLPLPQAAGLFWDNRDLAPTGPEGDRLLDQFATRLAQARLYEGAADLLAYQMGERAEDIEKGPVSEKVARYYLLAGLPGKALDALRATDAVAYPSAIDTARRTLQAIALYQLGHGEEALAILDDLPGTAGLREEMLWRRRDWKRIADERPLAAGRGALSPVAQATILRQAVALAMTGQEAGLAQLRTRYGPAFAGTPAAAAFALLTGPVAAMNGESLARAMAAIPSVAVAGDYDALLDARPAPPTPDPPPAAKRG